MIHDGLHIMYLMWQELWVTWSTCERELEWWGVGLCWVFAFIPVLPKMICRPTCV
jgi:hypothetical protein